MTQNLQRAYGVPIAELSRTRICRSPKSPAATQYRVGVVAGACYGLVQYSRFSPRSTFTGPSCRQAAAATATNSRPTTLCPPNAAPAGAAASAALLVPLLGDAGGRLWLKPLIGLPLRAGGVRNGEGQAASTAAIGDPYRPSGCRAPVFALTLLS
jgi:hypothetical protein